MRPESPLRQLLEVPPGRLDVAHRSRRMHRPIAHNEHNERIVRKFLQESGEKRRVLDR